MLRVITDPEADLELPLTSTSVPTLENVAGIAWIIGPVAPRTVGRVSADVHVRFAAGAAELVLEVRNEQAAAGPIVVVPSALRSPGAQPWRVEAYPRTLILAPNEARRVALRLGVDPAIPPGSYDGTIRLLGADDAVIRITAEVADEP